MFGSSKLFDQSYPSEILIVAANRHSEPQVPGVVGLRVVVVVVVVVVRVVGSGVVVSDDSVDDAVDVEAKSDLRSILLPMGGSSDGHPANSVVVLTLKVYGQLYYIIRIN